MNSAGAMIPRSDKYKDVKGQTKELGCPFFFTLSHSIYPLHRPNGAVNGARSTSAGARSYAA